ncbi:RNA polymerase sigma-70 factor [Sphingobacterium sp. ML3W]|uniref:RNA polymerase sigma factor n=1 Tax=Sphingobacterium sp. ML3W TaxID=1538644 RepID=UPI00249A01E0|nr:RNA polymerase sigma-70 factor [Sphingobacterium sp. ML3W]WFA81586.1 RNA polymerase sigma-70 factor [Sphingobacterium sp. ML3W]
MNFSACSDQQIFESVCQGEERALQHLMHRFWQPLFKTASVTMQDPEICQELVQNVFINIWRNREKINLRYSIKTYLFGCIRYEVFRNVKKKMDYVELKDLDEDYVDSFNPLLKLEYSELLDYLDQMINQLPDKCKEIFYLSRMEQLSHKEIAEKLNISVKTVENQISIALKRLKQGMQNMHIFFQIFFF